MVAYSFNRRFVTPIQVGLGQQQKIEGAAGYRPKRQTIRANGKRGHAREGDVLQLYCGMRTRQCFKIGEARCTAVLSITIRFPKPYRPHSTVRLPGNGIVLARDLDAFAVSDGFEDWAALREFWRENHPGVTDFSGVLIRWEPV